jgi:hypothetical protein
MLHRLLVYLSPSSSETFRISLLKKSTERKQGEGKVSYFHVIVSLQHKQCLETHFLRNCAVETFNLANSPERFSHLTRFQNSEHDTYLAALHPGLPIRKISSPAEKRFRWCAERLPVFENLLLSHPGPHRLHEAEQSKLLKYLDLIWSRPVYLAVNDTFRVRLRGWFA